MPVDLKDVAKWTDDGAEGFRVRLIPGCVGGDVVLEISGDVVLEITDGNAPLSRAAVVLEMGFDSDALRSAVEDASKA